MKLLSDLNIKKTSNSIFVTSEDYKNQVSETLRKVQFSAAEYETSGVRSEKAYAQNDKLCP